MLTDYRHEFNDDACFTSFDEEMAHIKELYSKPGKVKLIALTSEDEIVGCIAYQEFAPGIAEMKRLYVVPDHRRHHVGRLLTEAIITLARENGYEQIYLDTMPVMKAAQSLYERLGFHVIGPYNHQELNGMICYALDLKTDRR